MSDANDDRTDHRVDEYVDYSVDNPADDAALAAHEEAVARIVREGPHGAIAVAGVATAVLIGLWFAFYFLVYLPRGFIH